MTISYSPIPIALRQGEVNTFTLAIEALQESDGYLPLDLTGYTAFEFRVYNSDSELVLTLTEAATVSDEGVIVLDDDGGEVQIRLEAETVDELTLDPDFTATKYLWACHAIPDGAEDLAQIGSGEILLEAAL